MYIIQLAVLFTRIPSMCIHVLILPELITLLNVYSYLNELL